MPAVIIYIFIFAILAIIELGYFRIAHRFNIIDRGGRRASHKKPVIRGGGIIFLCAAWVYALFFGFGYPWFLAALTLGGLVSLADDIYSLPVGTRLFAQTVSVALVFFQIGLPTIHPLWILPIALILGVGLVNAFNFMDGINGITGGYAFAILIPLIYLNIQTPFISQPFLYTIAISIAIFSFFNYRRYAACFAGDVGSISIAIIILFALTALINRTGSPAYLTLVAIYGVDSAMTILHRLYLRENLFKAHRKHAYQIMANELKIPHTRIATLYSVLQLAISAGLIFLPINKNLYALAILILLAAAYLCFMKHNYHLHRAAYTPEK